MIHCTTYKSPNGSILGYSIEVKSGAKILGFKEYKPAQSDQMENDLYWKKEQEDMNVVRKQQTVTLRSFYGITA